MSKRRRRTQRSDAVNDQAAEQFMQAEADAHVEEVLGLDTPINEEAPPIPDEEIDAEVQALEEQAEEESVALDELAAADAEAYEDAEVDAREMSDEELADLPVVDLPDFDPPFDPEIFERGPLAAGIRMLEALLTEARTGYVTTQIEVLADTLDESFSAAEQQFLFTRAVAQRTAAGLPDVAGAYRELTAIRAQVPR